MLAVLYATGRGVPQNHRKAYKLMSDALNHGNVDAQHNMNIICKESPWACRD
jgi:TPR repeat protein